LTFSRRWLNIVGFREVTSCILAEAYPPFRDKYWAPSLFLPLGRQHVRLSDKTTSHAIIHKYLDQLCLK